MRTDSVMKRFAATAILAMLAASAALAQSPRPRGAAPAAPASDPNAPWDITAESSELFQQQRLLVAHGNVEAIQNQDRLRSPEVTVYYKERQGGPKPAGAQPGYSDQVDHIEAAGPVYYVTPTETVKGDHAYYDGATQTLTLTGNVILTQGKDVSTGDKLVSDRRTGHSVLSSNDPGVPARRVRAIIYPNQANQPGAAPAASKPPSKAAPSTAATKR